MVEGFATLARSGDEDAEVLLDLVLADQIGQFLRAEGVIDPVVGLGFGVEGSRTGVRHGTIIL
jgi:hypothetical protein